MFETQVLELVLDPADTQPVREGGINLQRFFRDGLAPALTGNAIANRYQEFERGTFGMYISGPWDVGEFRRRISPEMQSSWATAPLPGPDGPASGLSLEVHRLLICDIQEDKLSSLQNQC